VTFEGHFSFQLQESQPMALDCTLIPHVVSIIRLIAPDVVCVLSTQMSCAKTAEPIVSPLGEGWLTLVQGTLLDGGPDTHTEGAAAMGNKKAMRPFAKLLWTLVTHIIACMAIIYMPLYTTPTTTPHDVFRVVHGTSWQRRWRHQKQSIRGDRRKAAAKPPPS